MLDAYHCLFVWRFNEVLADTCKSHWFLSHLLRKLLTCGTASRKRQRNKISSRCGQCGRLPSAIISHRLPVVVPRTMGIPDVVLTILRLVPRAFLWSTLELLFECHWGVLNYQYVFVIGNWSLESDFASCWICVSWNRGPSLLEHAGIIGYPQFYQLFNLSRSIV